MKKLLILLCLFTLTACSSQKTLISNPDEVIISSSDNYTSQEFFEELKNIHGDKVAVGDLTERIARFEEIDMNEIDTKVDDYFKKIEELYKDQYEEILAAYGGEEVFRGTMKSSYTLDALVRKYGDYNFEEFVKEYEPVKARMVSFSDEAKAIDMIKYINEGKSFEDAAKEVGIQTVAKETVYTNTSDIDSELKNFFRTAEEGLVSEPFVVLVDKEVDGKVETTKTYYVINVVDKNAENFKEDFYKAISEDIKTEEVLNYYFEKYNVEVYDQGLYESLKETYESIK